MRGPGVAAFRTRERYTHATRGLLIPTTSTPFVKIEASSVLARPCAFVTGADLPEPPTKRTLNASPAPQGLFLSSYIRTSSAFTALQRLTPVGDGVLTPLAARFTQLVVAAPPANAWRAPKGTAEALGLIPSARNLAQAHRLTYLALPCRAHAIQGNDTNSFSICAMLSPHCQQLETASRRRPHPYCPPGLKSQQENAIMDSPLEQTDVSGVGPIRNYDGRASLLHTLRVTLRSFTSSATRTQLQLPNSSRINSESALKFKTCRYLPLVLSCETRPIRSRYRLGLEARRVCGADGPIPLTASSKGKLNGRLSARASAADEEQEGTQALTAQLHVQVGLSKLRTEDA